MEKLICPSLMCANFSNLKSEIQNLEAAGVDIFHMDVMDGNFVPNMALGLEDYQTVRNLTSVSMDVHLMVKRPKNFIHMFYAAGADIMYIHSEVDPMAATTLLEIKSLGMHPGLAINPGTAVESIKELLPLVDYVLVMTVNPGFSGQKFLDFVVPKIEKLAVCKNDSSFKLMVDGAISPKKISQLSKIGVDGFIVGTSSLFGKNKSYNKIVNELKEC
ncbi:ribulose-phosphate 3-epimerase [Liquorilactobacillus satsumensis]|uniref:ribulose-phosphate 3-epimerase n=1 Tax=Liquorilactobacillus TaxID=2767888 RepID=UPI001E4E872A|nr:ribulose-phosphate 3-epimerase [Liquorilactobacillus satsumensis]MCC7667227.1 ribulose-phosphate 3-epimerase [Liquorilactobacillus satsumensis]MCP9328088.1 ribulose-phosphate 3-epimerase [Liquorilactobacillus satsumensis]